MKASLALITVAGVLAATSPQALAANASPYLEIREEHWFEAMRIAEVDSEILYAIALVESGTSFKGMREYGPWPWAMNINEAPKFYSSREAARQILAEELETGNRQIAVGMWQIHLRYNAHYVDNPVDLIDPVTNLYTAAMVLRDCGTRYGTLRHVLSCYHSGDVDDAGVRYAEKVIQLARKWGQPYRLSAKPDRVRFVHTEPATPVAEKDAAIQVQRVIETEETLAQPDRPAVPRETISLAMLAAAKKPFVTESHKAFLRKIGANADSPPRRVIVLD